MTQRIELNQVIDAAPARVVLTRDADGGVVSAAFDLTGLPRVDALLAGRPLLEIPGLVEHLCGICPTAHHLAGMRALESLAGVAALPPTAMAVRRLLHHAGIIATHLVGFVTTDQDDALTLRRFAKAVMTATGSPGHFPVTAVPGGVVGCVDVAQRDACLALVPDALAAARRLAEARLPGAGIPDAYPGADVALVDAAGRLDLLGETLRAVGADGRELLHAGAGQWDSLVAESDPGSPAPRPYLVALGASAGSYRVGPVAQLRVGTVATPVASGLQAAWREAGGGAAAARAVVMVACVEAIQQLLDAPEAVAGPPAVDWPGTLPAGVGVGWVDSARGLLVHRYATAGDGLVSSATILTPTAQNEPWLGELLRSAAGGAAGGIEDAIREADPCLPCSTAPAGTMDLVVETKERG